MATKATDRVAVTEGSHGIYPMVSKEKASASRSDAGKDPCGNYRLSTGIGITTTGDIGPFLPVRDYAKGVGDASMGLPTVIGYPRFFTGEFVTLKGFRIRGLHNSPSP